MKIKSTKKLFFFTSIIILGVICVASAKIYFQEKSNVQNEKLLISKFLTDKPFKETIINIDGEQISDYIFSSDLKTIIYLSFKPLILEEKDNYYSSHKIKLVEVDTRTNSSHILLEKMFLTNRYGQGIRLYPTGTNEVAIKVNFKESIDSSEETEKYFSVNLLSRELEEVNQIPEINKQEVDKLTNYYIKTPLNRVSADEIKYKTKYKKIEYSPDTYIEQFLNCEIPRKCTWGGPRYEYVIRTGDKSYLVKNIQMPTITSQNHLNDFYGNIWFLEGYKLKKLE